MQFRLLHFGLALAMVVTLVSNACAQDDIYLKQPGKSQPNTPSQPQQPVTAYPPAYDTFEWLGFTTRAGLNINTVEEQLNFTNVSYQFRPGVQQYIGLDFDLSDNYGLSVELGYFQRNTQRSITIAGVPDTLIKDYLDLHYLSLPVCFQYHFSNRRETVKFTGLAGLQANFLMGGTYYQQAPNILGNSIFGQQVGNQLNQTDVCLVFGFKGKFKLADQIYLTSQIDLSQSSSSINNGLFKNQSTTYAVRLGGYSLSIGLCYQPKLRKWVSNAL